MMEFAKIVLLSVLAAVGYGIAHDSVTAHVCVEYFSVAHPPIFGGTHSPILLALGWGVIATWWVGLPLHRNTYPTRPTTGRKPAAPMIQVSRKSFDLKCQTMPPEYRAEVLAMVRRSSEEILFLSFEDYARLRRKWSGGPVGKTPTPRKGCGCGNKK